MEMFVIVPVSGSTYDFCSTGTPLSVIAQADTDGTIAGLHATYGTFRRMAIFIASWKLRPRQFNFCTLKSPCLFDPDYLERMPCTVSIQFARPPHMHRALMKHQRHPAWHHRKRALCGSAIPLLRAISITPHRVSPNSTHGADHPPQAMLATSATVAPEATLAAEPPLAPPTDTMNRRMAPECLAEGRAGRLRSPTPCPCRRISRRKMDIRFPRAEFRCHTIRVIERWVTGWIAR